MDKNIKNQNDIENRASCAVREGDILLSSPLLTDPNFSRTAVLVLRKDADNGHIGLVLNRRLDLSLEEICQLQGEAGRHPVYSGGPVDLQRLFWIHTFGEELPGALEVLPGIFVGGDYNVLSDLLASGRNPQGEIRFYLGYSGWTSGQLDREVQVGAWGILRNILDPQMLLENDGQEMWQQLVRRLGKDFRHWLILPVNPDLN